MRTVIRKNAGADARAAERKARERRAGERGLTLIELIVAFTILCAADDHGGAAGALTKSGATRSAICATRCARFARRSTIIRTRRSPGKIEVKLGTDGYPETLEQLVDGVKLLQSPDGKKIKFLRRIPLDPMTNTLRLGQAQHAGRPRRRTAGAGRMFSTYIPRARSRHAMERPIQSGDARA